jgi:protein arginine kinase activator
MTQIVNGKTSAMRLCNDCAEKHGFFDKEGLPFSMLSNLGEALLSGLKQNASIGGLICSKCGCTPMSFKETSRLGCPNCYRDLKPLVDGIVESSQKGMVHKGKRPKGRGPTDAEKPEVPTVAKEVKKKSAADPLDDLLEKLNDAIAEERYEDAAKLRDRIRKAKKKAGGAENGE